MVGCNDGLSDGDELLLGLILGKCWYVGEGDTDGSVLGNMLGDSVGPKLGYVL